VDTEVKSERKSFSSVSSVSSVVACFVVFAALVCAQGKGWSIPENAASETNPLNTSPEVLKKGEALYKSFCATCHGPSGLGDGPDVDRHDKANRPANLPLSRNPEGVVFYKIWNGRQDPKMPAFKSQLTRKDTWTVVAYVMSMRP
jgi:mono/diheme cytochrome c family protein